MALTIRRRGRPVVAEPPALTLATTLSGDPVRFELGTGSLGIFGSTGSGKSVAMRAALWSAAGRADTALILADLKGGVELAAWLPRAVTMVSDRPAAVDVLAAVRVELDLRTAILRDAGRTDWDPALGPFIIVALDELAELLQAPAAEAAQAKAASALVQSLARLGRACGIHLIAATQHPSAEILTTSLRGQFTSTMALRVRDESTQRLVTQGAPCNLTSLGDLPPGHGYWLTSSSSWPALCRATYHPVEDVPARAAETSSLAPQLELAGGAG